MVSLSEELKQENDPLTRSVAWTARASVHWIGSMIGVTLLVAAKFATLRSVSRLVVPRVIRASGSRSDNFQEGVFLYIVLSYPHYAASILAANDALRSIVRVPLPSFLSCMLTLPP